MKKTKVTIFIAMVCLLLVGATALPIGDAVSLPKVKKPQPINIDGLRGDISLMSSTYWEGNQYTKPIALNNKVKYFGLQGAKAWAFDNAIELSNGQHTTVGDYIIDYQTGKLMKLVEKNETAKCGYKIRNIDTDEDGTFDKRISIKRFMEGFGKVKVPKICFRLKQVWEEVNMNVPAE